MANFADPSIGAVSGELVFEQADGFALADGIGAYWLYEKFIRNSEARTGSVVGVTGAPMPYGVSACAHSSGDHPRRRRHPDKAAMKGWRVSFEGGAPTTSLHRRSQGEKSARYAPGWQLPAGQPLPGTAVTLAQPLVGTLHGATRCCACYARWRCCWLSSATACWPSRHLVFRATWALHLGGYILMALAMLVPALQRFKLLRLAVTFAHLNIFVVLGLFPSSPRSSLIYGEAPDRGEQPHGQNPTQEVT